MTIYLPPALALEVRIRSVRERRSVSDAITAAVASWVKGEEP